MLRPDGAHLFSGGKVATCDFGIRLVEVEFFFLRQPVNGLFFSSKLKKNPRQSILLMSRETAKALDGVVYDARHDLVPALQLGLLCAGAPG